MTSESGWYAVRCVLLHGVGSDEDGTYGERITLWNASSAERAIERAETEAREYAVGLPGSATSGWRSPVRSSHARQPVPARRRRPSIPWHQADASPFAD